MTDEKRTGGVIGWFREGSPAARRSLIAAALGWMLDAFDVLLYSLVIRAMMADIGLTITMAGFLGALTLAASGLGGVVFGVVADRFGRRRAMMLSILTYSIFTGVQGFTQAIWQLAICRIVIGLGMGGEWTSGAALVSETWPDRHRAKAIAFMHSFFAVGGVAAGLVVGYLLPQYGWRAVFFVGALPALLVLWIQSGVEESPLWLQSRTERAAGKPKADTGAIFRPPLRRLTILLTGLSLFTLFAYWGLNFWVPTYLSLPIERGGAGLDTAWTTRIFVAMQIGMWFGLVSFGHVCDAVGRRRSYVLYLIVGAIFVLFVIFLPKGIWGTLLEKLGGRYGPQGA